MSFGTGAIGEHSQEIQEIASYDDAANGISGTVGLRHSYAGLGPLLYDLAPRLRKV
jgi:hypothetical protein